MDRISDVHTFEKEYHWGKIGLQWKIKMCFQMDKCGSG